jgi:hypothetical protein
MSRLQQTRLTQEQRFLYFTVSGKSGTTGFSNVTIPVNAILYGTTPTIYIDGQPASNQGYTKDSDNYYVWYTTSFSTHQLSIVFITPPSQPNNTSQFSLLQASIYEISAVAAIVAIVAVVLASQLRKTRQTKS